MNISPRLVPSIASLYNDVNRVFLEYIDNSLDSAEELFDNALNAYKRKVIIKVSKNGKRYTDGKIIISDNCSGINNLEKVVKSIGDSDKKAQPWTNGQFGYGIYSFMAACGKLEIVSKERDKRALYIPIEKEKFEESRQEDVLFPDFKVVDFDNNTGTKITLSEFDKHSWKQITCDELSKEIAIHFEAILNRDELRVYVENEAGEERRCRPFNYEDFEGDVYRETM